MKTRNLLVGTSLLVLLTPAIGAADFFSANAQQGGKGKKGGANLGFHTFVQGEWGENCDLTHRVGCMRDQYFDKAFKRGLTIGRASSDPEKKQYQVQLPTSQSVRRFLPVTGPAATLSREERGAAKETGMFGGQLVAAKLNVAFNDRGFVWTQNKGRGKAMKMSQLVLMKEVDADLVGMTVGELLGLSDRVISAEYGKCTTADCVAKDLVDTNKDGKPDVSVQNLVDALAVVNRSFRNGQNHGLLSRRGPALAQETTDAVEVAEEAVEVAQGQAGEAAETAKETAEEVDAAKEQAPSQEAGEAAKEAAGSKAESAGGKLGEAAGKSKDFKKKLQSQSGLLCTFSQKGWGQDSCDGANVACIRDEYFERLFPRGLVVGDPAAQKGDESYNLVLTSSAAVANLLPIGGGATTLQGDAKNPTASEAGVLVGHLVAAKLNFAYNRARVSALGGDPSVVNRMVIVGGVAQPLQGMSVGELLKIADMALAGEFGPVRDAASAQQPLVDVNKDRKLDVSLNDISSALETLNNNYPNCKGDRGYLSKPEGLESVKDAVPQIKPGQTKKVEGRTPTQKQSPAGAARRKGGLK